MNYEEWEQAVPGEIKADSLWKMKAYRLALYLSELAWHDVTQLAKDARTMKLADQLYRSVGSIGANIAEGYSRSGGKARAIYYEYSLGSARESRDWYFKARYLLGEENTRQRIVLTTEIIRLLLTMIPNQRAYTIREGTIDYEINHEENLEDIPN
jgi:four helix bundle protein